MLPVSPAGGGQGELSGSFTVLSVTSNCSLVVIDNVSHSSLISRLSFVQSPVPELLITAGSLRMGCSSSKASTNVAMRVMEYQHLANTENEGLTMVPARLDTEEWRDGLMRNVLS